jgi:hypothetical protein
VTSTLGADVAEDFAAVVVGIVGPGGVWNFMGGVVATTFTGVGEAITILPVVVDLMKIG